LGDRKQEKNTFFLMDWCFFLTYFPIGNIGGYFNEEKEKAVLRKTFEAYFQYRREIKVKGFNSCIRVYDAIAKYV